MSSKSSGNQAHQVTPEHPGWDVLPAIHQQVFDSVSESVWQPDDGRCDECGTAWPCQTIEVFEEFRRSVLGDQAALEQS